MSTERPFVLNNRTDGLVRKTILDESLIPIDVIKYGAVKPLEYMKKINESPSAGKFMTLEIAFRTSSDSLKGKRYFDCVQFDLRKFERDLFDLVEKMNIGMVYQCEVVPRHVISESKTHLLFLITEISDSYIKHPNSPRLEIHFFNNIVKETSGREMKLNNSPCLVADGLQAVHDNSSTDARICRFD